MKKTPVVEFAILSNILADCMARVISQK